MKKVIILLLLAIFLSGCSATYNVTIDKNAVTEDVTAVASNDTEYSKLKNWSGFPLTLYYDQEISNPFGEKREKESGIKYYENTSDDSTKTTKVRGSFNMNEFSKSSLVRGCFKYFNVIQDGNVVTFSTSVGLICNFSNFNVVVDTDYKVLNSNADNVNAETNTYTWNYSTNTNKSVYLEIDFAHKYNESNSNNKSSTDISTSKENKIAIIVILIAALVSSILGFLIYLKKKSDSLNS